MLKSVETLLEKASHKKNGKNDDLIYDGSDSRKLAQAWLLAKEKMDLSKAKVEEINDTLEELLTPWHREQCRKNGHAPSVLIQGKEDNVRVSFQDKFSKIKVDKETILRTILGEAYEKLITKEYGLKVRKEIVEDPKQLQDLVKVLAEALGKERFADFFQVDPELVPTTDFTHKMPFFDKSTLDQLAEAGVKQTVAIAKAK